MDIELCPYCDENDVESHASDYYWDPDRITCGVCGLSFVLTSSDDYMESPKPLYEKWDIFAKTMRELREFKKDYDECVEKAFEPGPPPLKAVKSFRLEWITDDDL